MSRRRRVALLAGLIALVLAVAGVLVLQRRGGVDQALPGPVLLVPGYGGDRASLEPLARALRGAGRQATVVDTGDGTGDLRTQAEALARAADAALAAGAPSVDVVGYSAGGVVARVWVADLGGDDEARRVVTLGSPHHGTTVASLGAVLASGACPTACRQLAQGSELLDGLPDAPSGPRWVSLWTADDETVTPPDSAVLAGAVDVRLQDVCAGVRVGHGALPSDPLVAGLVLRSLGVAGLDAPPPAADCGALRSSGDAALSS
ncbi:esterase/lipase family protein [Phycicoccus flavus]|uniref:Lipase n=1 Tax=Phycicoccus flavus TaxID=2502783 RepID=A0A8T6R672_9MICO|nr:lipase [Phycicoccus flavus]NHA69134.1 lipase [Phycicoccus flavus]